MLSEESHHRPRADAFVDITLDYRAFADGFVSFAPDVNRSITVERVKTLDVYEWLW